MPAMLDDPSAPTIYRTSGGPPYPTPDAPIIPSEIAPRQVVLRDRVTTATIVPFSSPNQVPPGLLGELCALLNSEIEKGDTYPMMTAMYVEDFANYWFANFGAVMLLGAFESENDVWALTEDPRTDWKKLCLGALYVKPNYPGRSSHICNGGFLVSSAARNRGVGRLMGELYLDWAPKLGYTYSVFNLVYETNAASIKIWDALGFKRIGRVKGAGNLKSHPEVFVDAIIYGRSLDAAPEDVLNEERFDKIREYLRTGAYPDTADRAEKGRLRSAAIHYRLEPPHDNVPEKLMLRDKEVVSEPHRQFEIAHRIHIQGHAGINKTTAQISEKYHWVRIKETVSQAIKLCSECKDGAKRPGARPSEGGSHGADDSQVHPEGVTTDEASLQAQQTDQYPVYDDQHGQTTHDVNMQQQPPRQGPSTGNVRARRQSTHTGGGSAVPLTDPNLLSGGYNDQMMQSVDPSIVGHTAGASRSVPARLTAQQVQNAGVAPTAPIAMGAYDQSTYHTQQTVPADVAQTQTYPDGSGGGGSGSGAEHPAERQASDGQAVQGETLATQHGGRRGVVRPFDRAFPAGQ